MGVRSLEKVKAMRWIIIRILARACGNFRLVTVLIEAAVESLDAALAAAEGGAHRLELCTDLAHGGTTPDVQLLRECRSQLVIPIFVLVRPRAGDFVYTAAEHRTSSSRFTRRRTRGRAAL